MRLLSYCCCSPLLYPWEREAALQVALLPYAGFFGELSYPLYITHFPLVYLQKSWVYYHPDAPLSAHVAVAVCVYVMAVANAWAAYKLYDLPVRAWLKARLFPAKEKSRR